MIHRTHKTCAIYNLVAINNDDDTTSIKLSVDFCTVHPRVYLPQMCSMKTDAMKSNDITRTGTGPLKKPHEI